MEFLRNRAVMATLGSAMDSAGKNRYPKNPAKFSQGGVETIRPYVDDFIELAREWDQTTFYVTRIGCGIAGFTDEEIAPLFAEALSLYNVRLPESFVKILQARSASDKE